MGSKVEKHLSRLAMPKTWKLKRKGRKWIVRPLPGAHSFKLGLPLTVLLRDLLSYARTSKEVKNILNNQEVLVDGIRRKEQKLIVGLMDVISIPKLKKQFRMLLNKKGKIVPIEVADAESKIKICKINGKTVVKKGKLQINLHDGKNILTDDKSLKVGDSLVIELPSKKIKDKLKLEKGALVYLTGGNHIGENGVVEDIKGKKLVYKKGTETLETLKEYAFVVGKEKSAIKLI